MADLFAPKFQGDVAFERPLQAVEQPSALAALAGLGEFFVKDYGAKLAADAQAATKRSSSIDPNLSVFQQGLERIQALRDQKGEAAALIAERQLAKNFALQGVEFDADYQNVYTATTGRPWAGYGRDNESFMREQALQDPQVQASYIASFAMLPKDSTDEQRIEYAIGQKATLQASADVIARSKAEAGYAWSVETEAAYGKAIDTFLSANLGSLVSTVQGGGRVGPQALANLQASWSQLKVNISRPSGVADEQWKSTQDKINNIDSMLTNLQKASSSDVLFEEITTAMANSLIQEGGGDVTSLLSAMTAIKDPSSLTNLMGGNVETFIMEAGKSINLNITQPQLFSHLLGQSTGQQDGDVITITELPPTVQSKIQGLSPQQYYDGLKASGQLAALIDPNAIQRPEGRQQFVENAAGIGAVMMSMENDQFLSSDFIKQLVANPQFLRNVTALEAVDPEGAAVVRSYIISGLNTELARQQRNVGAIEQGLGAVWDGSKYVITRESIMQKGGFTEEQADRFLAWVGKTYGGNTELLAQGMVPLPEGLGFNPQGLSSAYDRRNAMTVIQDTVRMLTPDMPQQAAPELTVETLTGQTSTDLIRTAESALGLNENKQRALVSQYLAEGGVNIDPSQTAWCAAFVNATLSKTGLDGTGALNARSFLNWGEEVTTPQLGDVVVLSRGTDPNLGHVGFFKGFDAQGNILILGGNQGDEVSVKSYSADRLLGYRRPAGSTNVGTEAGLTQNIYRAATDPSFMPAPVAPTQPLNAFTAPIQVGDQTIGAAPVEEQPQEQPTQEAATTPQPTAQETAVSPEVQALLDSLTGASEEEKQRIVEFLGR
jgi:uncharacterized protein (TIGR02594 family)